MAKVLLHRYGTWLRALIVLAALAGVVILLRANAQQATAAIPDGCNLKVGLIIDRSNSVKNANTNNPTTIRSQIAGIVNNTGNHKNGLQLGFWTFGTAGSGFVGQNPLKRWFADNTIADIPAGMYPAINFIRMDNAAHRGIFMDRINNIPYYSVADPKNNRATGWTNWEVALGSNQPSSYHSGSPWVGNTTAAGIAGAYPGVISTPATGDGTYTRAERNMPQDADMVILITDDTPTVPQRFDYLGWGGTNGQAEPEDHAVAAARRLGQAGVQVNAISIPNSSPGGEEGPPSDPATTLKNLQTIVRASNSDGIVLQGGWNQLQNNIQTIMERSCTETITKHPYLKVYGNDVSAGGGFGTPSCSIFKDDASINAYVRNETVGGTTNWYGASSQFAAFARGPITQFYSDSARSSAPASQLKSPVDLTFGNTSTGSSKVGIYGPVIANDDYPDIGGYSGQANCIKDYYAEGIQKGGQPETGSSKTLNSLPAKKVMYVDGDVFINGNIEFPTTANWASPNSIPSFMLVVKGNINIAPHVTRLDGIYIAQPEGNNEGVIRTCAASNSGATPASCTNKLTINGAFIAKQVRFKRSNGDYKAASMSANEQPDSGNIAEVFNFSPETYLSPLDRTQVRGLPYQKYDYITSLPPVL